MNVDAVWWRAWPREEVIRFQWWSFYLWRFRIIIQDSLPLRDGSCIKSLVIVIKSPGGSIDDGGLSSPVASSCIVHLHCQYCIVCTVYVSNVYCIVLCMCVYCVEGHRVTVIIVLRMCVLCVEGHGVVRLPVVHVVVRALHVKVPAGLHLQPRRTAMLMVMLRNNSAWHSVVSRTAAAVTDEC